MSPGVSNVLRLGAWAVLVLSAVFFLTTGGTYPGIASVEGHLIGQIVAIAILGGWLALSLGRPAWRARSPLLLPVALACLAYGASAMVSQRPRLSLEPTIAGLGWGLAVLFLGRLLTEAWFRARAAVLMTAFVAVVAFGYLGQVAIEWISWWGIVGRFAVPPLRPSFAALFLGSPNLIGTALVLLAPLVVAITWTRYRRHGLASALAVASAIAIFVSGSRGAWLGAGIGLVVALGLAITRRGARGSIDNLVARARRRPILLAPVVVAIGGLLLLAPSVIARFEQGGASLRQDLWRSALAIFADHPILGAGPGTWVQLKVAANPDGVPNLILPHAHDLYIQSAAELGLVGLAALGILAGAVGRRLWSAWGSDHRLPGERRDGARSVEALSMEAGAVIVSLAAFAGQSIVDNLVNLPFVCLILVALVAWVDGGLAAARGAAEPQPRAWSPRLAAVLRGPALPVVGLLAMAIVIPTLVRIDRAASTAQDGNRAVLRGDWDAALDAFEAASGLDPGFTLYDLQAASALGRAGRTAEAREVLARAAEADPVAINVIGLAALEAELGERDAALGHARQAAALGVGDPTVALNAGLVAERLGDRDLALDQFANAIAWDPPLASGAVWASPPRSIALADAVAAARDRVDPLTAALILAYAGQASAAKAELLTQPPTGQVEVYIAATEWLDGDPSAALARLDSMLLADPRDWYAAAWAARIARLSGDVATARRYSAWAIAVQGDAAPATIAELSVAPADADAATAGLPGNYPWAVYLRPVTPYLPVPQLMLIGSR
jgi:O-antigen ligase/tetratricopeptide (TPR) repeat protein